MFDKRLDLIQNGGEEIIIKLIDVVYTTGTTVAECSRVLFAAGAREVHVLTLARVRE